MAGTTRRGPTPAHLDGLDRYEPGLPIEEVQRRHGLTRVVKLASNENPLGPSPRGVAAARDALAQVNRYPDGPATQLRKALAGRLGVGADQVVLGDGSSELIDLVARAFLGPEHNAVIAEEAFPRFRQSVRARNRNARLVPMREHTHDLAAMGAAVDEHTRLVFVANPNNPTGTWNHRAELEALLRGLPPQVLLVLDQAYFEYVEEPDYPDGVALVREAAPLVVLRTFSKAYGLAGLRVGYAVARDEVIRAIDTIREPFNVSSVAQAAALAALEDREHVARGVASNRVELPRLERELVERGIGVLPSLGNFLCIDVGRDGRGVFEALLRRGVIVRPLGGSLARFLRVSVGTPPENDAFLEALDAVLAEPAARR